jgi:hypothetical protein
MADWPTIASLATAGGTLVLAVATFSSVRSAQRATRLAERSTQISERALLVGLRPVLVPSRESDPVESVRFVEGRTVNVEGGMAGIEHEDESFYFVMPLRNVGPGLGVIHGWYVTPAELQATRDHADPEEFRPQTLDLYVPAGDIGFWQGAVREPDDPFRPGLAESFAAGETLMIELLYGDHEGGQRTISRFIATHQDDGRWRARVVRHWPLEAPDPRHPHG